uniref:Cytochrome c oxidase accessory protein FixG n=1 Tax=Candidatus Kentrum sp. FM TaxID=2126340 RepID=A0A450VWD6_9GAMM|nr:MAG: cytochrome c oxidase accessory protein FixG [Candidatus Kentron sp. FM]VFJ51726.1 MAG: cytochrome c oxidase accessory protein FixG [Candidatus Kentron sp. FM]VFK09097.1 MAG: cytochrome c oxidase accessory protein FixG [Candidatus Kentron sp. FM]
MKPNTSDKHAAPSAAYAEYVEDAHRNVNVGGQTIHARRDPGKWRTIKWITNAIWLLFFFGAYLRWDDRQAVLWDIPHRQFHLFGVTILPQDFWLLSLVLLFFAMLLAVAAAVAGRVWCGFFCFQTVWTDIFTWIEDKLEGNPQKRRKLDKAPWDAAKLRIKAIKHALWLLISVLTGIAFVGWFTDAYGLWVDLVTLEASPVVWTTIALFTAGTYLLAGFMREQVCFWLCPYARIQSAMVDRHTVIPTYDVQRGEPRGHVKKKRQAGQQTPVGDCVDCHLCVAVCPTGVDIRAGLQEGCLMCALCLDACDGVMDKLRRPRGLIRYASLDEIESGTTLPLLGRTRIWVYGLILLIAAAGVVYGLTGLDSVDLKVLHTREPLYVLQSNGSIQNQYTLKVLNKMTHDIDVRISATGPAGFRLVNAQETVTARASKVTPATVFAQIPRENLGTESVPITFRIEGVLDSKVFVSERESIFVGP